MSPARAFATGARGILVLSIGAIAFGLALGAVIATAPVNDWVGASSSVIVLAGAAQLAMVDLMGRDAPWFIVIGTALVINARFALYSAALAPSYAAFPKRWKLLLGYMLTDQAAAYQLHSARDWPDPVARRWFYFGGASLFAGFALVGTVIGVLVGPVIPAGWQIGFIVPLMFIALLVRGLGDRASVVAAVTAMAVVVLARDLPYGTNVLAGALAGIIVARVAVPASWFPQGPHVDEPAEEGSPG